MADVDSTGLHRNDDVDTSSDAHHHTLGIGRNKAMPGDVLRGISVSSADLATIVAALVELGATDASP